VADQLGEDGGTRRSCQFSGDIDLTKWDSSQNLGGSGSGEWEGAVGTLDCACSFDRNGGGDVGKAQMMEADGGHDNIDDRIDCTDLVEMDFIDQFSVEAGLGFGNTVKDFKSGVFDGGSEVRLLQEGTDLSPGATVLVFMGVIVRMRVGVWAVFVRCFDKEAGTG